MPVPRDPVEFRPNLLLSLGLEYVLSRWCATILITTGLSVIIQHIYLLQAGFSGKSGIDGVFDEDMYAVSFFRQQHCSPCRQTLTSRLLTA